MLALIIPLLVALSSIDDPFVVIEIPSKTANFYAQELLTAGACNDPQSAHIAAEQECFFEDPAETYHFYTIVDAATSEYRGYLWYSIKEKTARIEALFIEDMYRGKGIAKQVLDLFEASMRSQDIGSITLYVFVHNASAFSLYKKNGYAIASSYFNGDNLVGYIMEKALLANDPTC